MNKERIASAVTFFLDYIKNKSISSNTHINYAVDIRQFADYLEEQKIENLEDVGTPQLRAYLRGMFGWGYSKATISRKLSALRSFFSFLKEHGTLERDPMRTLRGPAAPKGIPRALSAEAIGMLFDMALTGEDPVRDVAILEIFYGCGLRISELTSLKWNEIDLQERWLVILGKGNKERRVPFGSYAQKALLQLKVAADPLNGFVFAGRKGKSLTVRTVHRVVTNLAARAGLQGITPHVLRHSCATHLLEKGASLKFVQEFLGHENMATTQVYLAISASWMKESYIANHPRANLYSETFESD